MGLCQSLREVSHQVPKSIAAMPPLPASPMISASKYKKSAIPKSLKKLVWDTYIGPNIGISKCMCCLHQDIRQIDFHCGHVISECSGGSKTIENLVPICSQCNLSMGRQNLNEFKLKYFKVLK